MKHIIFFLFALLTGPFSWAQNSLPIPAALTGSNFNLTLQHDSVVFYPGYQTNTMGVNGALLGPTLIFQQGDYVNINVTNQLIDTTTMHWHGMHVPAGYDGGPHSKIYPNTTWSPSFTIMDRASTMWYHPHLMHKTNEHVQMGIAGFIIIKDSLEAALMIPRTYGVDDIPLVFQTKSIDVNRQIDVNMNNSALDTMLLTNGVIGATLNAPSQVMRFRLLNGASERSFNIGLSNNANFQVIGSDGGLLAAPISMSRLLISNGERYEILVDLSSNQGDTIQIMNYGSTISGSVYGTASISGMGGATIPNYSSNPLNGANFPLLTMHVTSSTANPVTSIPTALVPTNVLNVADANHNRTMAMAPAVMGPQGSINGPFRINNATFNMSVINEVVPLNNTEIWTLTNQSAIAHPFHIHDVQFNVIEVNGVAPPLHQQGWKDVILVPDHQGSVKFITKFEDFADPIIPYMYHCHILTHEDGGMMGQFTVVDNSSGLDDIHYDNFSIYPNPAEDFVQIALKGNGPEPISITNALGQVVIQGSITAQTSRVNLSQLSPGMYIIRIGAVSEPLIVQ